MTPAVSRAVMTLAVSCLGQCRHEWALAMQGEFEAAREDGKPLSFALGCLAAAWRDLPAHEEGRFMIASHLLAFVLMVPTAALLLSSMLAGFPYSYLGAVEAQALLEASRGPAPLLSDANRSALPPLAALLVLLAGSHLRIAWLVLERDWTRVAAAAALAAAATVTLILFTTLVFSYCAAAPAHLAVLAIELGCLSALARWHSGSVVSSAEAPT